MKEFTPAFTPKEMLSLGVFEGKYLNSTRKEYPEDWFTAAKLSHKPNPSVNFFGIKSRSPLSAWKESGWIHPQDPFGWFQWYARWSMGRRTEDDARQIGRWNSFARHTGQILANPGSKRLRQRQALLQWARDPFPDFESLKGETMVQKINRCIEYI